MAASTTALTWLEDFLSSPIVIKPYRIFWKSRGWPGRRRSPRRGAAAACCRREKWRRRIWVACAVWAVRSSWPRTWAWASSARASVTIADWARRSALPFAFRTLFRSEICPVAFASPYCLGIESWTQIAFAPLFYGWSCYLFLVWKEVFAPLPYCSSSLLSSPSSCSLLTQGPPLLRLGTFFRG